MDINLEKIDILRERTGVSYKEAREVLEETNGDLVEALIKLEEKSDKNWYDTINVTGNDVIEKLKAIIKKGNVTRVILKKDGEIMLNIPVTAGAIGVVLGPLVSIVGVSAAIASRATIEIVKNNGEVVDINDMAEEKINEFKSKMKPKDTSTDEITEDIEETLDKIDDGADF
ncbi:DUF4342 domain-containing protein [Alkaliphilus peptidifermentans]|uniref:DUF4342 domain-containing protein n=1 Tax=Alkaliphilus peptidifermentans DSM 18978 TaxID=1120976 RepID=A0A1G5BU07_9FIRM|nr:DUF4342 domain-containing protein [Alkaliphilus peptidifermentans]SCX93556.1 protein of unknown function [Alkaliphilus peptidifermentans DSM 18978]